MGQLYKTFFKIMKRTNNQFTATFLYLFAFFLMIKKVLVNWADENFGSEREYLL